MNLSRPFILRPIGTSLLVLGITLAGLLGLRLLPTASLPTVDFPTIQVTTEWPGASAETMEALVTAPLEKWFERISRLSSMTSVSSLGISTITLRFELGREIDAAAQDIQAAINGATGLLPRALPYRPIYRKVNPADTPIMVL